MTAAILPESLDLLSGVGHIEELSKAARTLMFALLTGAVYSMLTLLSTADKEIVLRLQAPLLPNLDTPVPVVGFFIVGPLFLAAVYMYLHLQLLRLWDAIGGLPSRTVSGQAIDQLIHPWLVSNLVARQFPLLRENPPRLFWVQDVACTFLAWWAAPLTLLFVWGRYLVMHDWLGSALHILLVAFALGCAASFRDTARSAVGGAGETRPIPLRPVVAVGLVLVSLSVSPALLARSHEAWVWVNSLRQVGYTPFADLAGADLKEARLGGARLERANLVEAQLENARLAGASLNRTVLWTANFERAVLRDASLRDADASQAVFDNAILKGADLSGIVAAEASFVDVSAPRSRFDGADLQNAILEDARFTKAHMTGVIASSARADRADFAEADLTDAVFVGTHLRDAVLRGATLAGANLTSALLQGADLRGAKALNADQLRSACLDASTKLPQVDGFAFARYTPPDDCAKKPTSTSQAS